jgi:hypothetical protein
MAGSPIATARAQDCSIEPIRRASQDHSLCTWLSAGSDTRVTDSIRSR